MTDTEHIVAVDLLTRSDVDRLGPGFKRLFPVDEAPCFGALIEAIDQADRELRDRKSR